MTTEQEQKAQDTVQTSGGKQEATAPAATGEAKRGRPRSVSEADFKALQASLTKQISEVRKLAEQHQRRAEDAEATLAHIREYGDDPDKLLEFKARRMAEQMHGDDLRIVQEERLAAAKERAEAKGVPQDLYEDAATHQEIAAIIVAWTRAQAMRSVSNGAGHEEEEQPPPQEVTANPGSPAAVGGITTTKQALVNKFAAGERMSIPDMVTVRDAMAEGIFPKSR